MSKIHHNIYEKINYTIELPYVSEPINKLAEYIDLLPNHLNILNPINLTYDAKNTVYLHCPKNNQSLCKESLTRLEPMQRNKSS